MSCTFRFYLVREGYSVSVAHAQALKNPDRPCPALLPLDEAHRDEIAGLLRASDPDLFQDESAYEPGEIFLDAPGTARCHWTISERGCELFWPDPRDAKALGRILLRTRPGIGRLLKRGFLGFDLQTKAPMAWPADWDALQSGCGPLK